MQQFCKNWRLRYNRRIVLNYRVLSFILVQNLSLNSLNNFFVLRPNINRVDGWQTRVSQLQRFLLRKSSIRNLFYI
jgi:hypothetical protein